MKKPKRPKHDPLTRDLFRGRKLRDQGLEQVSSKNLDFMTATLSALATMRSEHPGEVSGEDIRMWMQLRGIHPRHHNAWGAAVNHAQRLGLIIFAQKYTSMKAPRSHARRTPVYRWASGLSLAEFMRKAP